MTVVTKVEPIFTDNYLNFKPEIGKEVSSKAEDRVGITLYISLQICIKLKGNLSYDRDTTGNINFTFSVRCLTPSEDD